MHWVGWERKKKRGRNVLDAQIDGGCLVVPPNSPFSYEGAGGRARARIDAPDFDVDLKQRMPMKAETVGIALDFSSLFRSFSAQREMKKKHDACS